MSQEQCARSRRIAYLDYLRSLAIFQVVLWHASIILLNEFPHNPSAWLQIDAIHCFTPSGVPIFVLMSGALMLSNSGPLDFLAYYRRRLPKLIYPLIFWTVIYIIWKQTVMGAKLGLSEVLTRAFEGQLYGPLWFLWMMIGLCLAAPFIKILYDNLSRKQLNLFFLLWMIFTFIKPLSIVFYNIKFGLFQYDSFFPKYVGYFMLGAVLHRVTFNNPLKAKFLVLITFIASSLAILTFSYLHLLHAGISEGFYSSADNFLVLSQAVSLFLFVKLVFEERESAAPLVAKLSAYSYSIYLLHMMPLEFVNYILRLSGAYRDLLMPWLVAPLTAGLVFWCTLQVSVWLRRFKLADTFLPLA